MQQGVTACMPFSNNLCNKKIIVQKPAAIKHYFRLSEGDADSLWVVLSWVASFDGPSAFLETLLILYFCCVLVQVLLLCGK